MASEAGDEAASVASRGCSREETDRTSSSSSSSSAEEEEVVVQEEEQAPVDGGREQQRELPEGWLRHTICGAPYDGSIYEEVTGGKKGQDPSPAYAYTVREKDTSKPKCLLCQHSGNSPYLHNFLPHLRSHTAFREYEQSLGKGWGGGKGGKRESGGCTCGGTFTWSEDRKARMRRLIVSMVVVHGRCVLHVCLEREYCVGDGSTQPNNKMATD
jgi:diadenosine tetraphosphatase ApaH/serine/threonine PP2A family protein phosphatase